MLNIQQPGGQCFDLGGLIGMISHRSLGLTTYVYDTFTDTDDTALTSHSPDVNLAGNPWTAGSGTWKITSNYAYTSASLYNINVVHINVGKANAAVTADVYGNSNYSSDERKLPGIVGRYKDISNFWCFGFWPGSDTIAIVERNAGTFYTRATATYATSVQTYYTLKMTFAGDLITGEIGGTSVSYTSSNLNTYTKFGLKTDMDTLLDRFDNFKVEA